MLIVDVIMQYDNPQTGNTYALVFKNALCVLHMDHNLMPSFLMREAGLIVDDVPKSQTLTPENINH